VSFEYRIERLGKQDRSTFDCGNPALSSYLKRQAGQDERRRVAACYLLIEQTSGEIAGYYTLSAGSVLLTDLPKSTTKKLPRYPSVPVARIGRLAVDVHFQGKKLGGVLLFDAIKRAAASEMGVHAIVVDATDDQAVAFYEHHGFTAFESAPQTLYLAISTALARLGNG